MAAPLASHRGLLERDGELMAVSAALERAAGGEGSVLAVEGPAGIGKTELLRAAADLAVERGAGVLTARGGELEREFPFGIVRQLLEPAVRDADLASREALLSGAAGLAAHVLGFGDESGSGPPGDLGPVLHGLYWLVSNLAEVRPLLLVVDDVQWADEASMAFCHYLARRVEHLAVVLVPAERRLEVGPEQPVLARVMLEPSARVLRPAPLSREAVAHLVRDVAQDAQEAFCEAVHTASGGNPLLVGALLGEVERSAVAPTASEADRVAELAPEVVTRSVLVRLARLPDACRRLAEAVAVLGRSAALRLAAELSELDQDKAATCADALAGAGILTGARPLEFLHPLLRQAVYAHIPSGQRGLAHARAARLLEDAGAEAAVVATQLLPSEPAGDPRTVAALRRAAELALADGLPLTAITFLERALVEPPASAERPETLFELGRAHAWTMNTAEAMTRLDEALRLGIDPGRRVEAGIVLARLLGMVVCDLEGGLAVLDGLAAGPPLGPELVARIEVERLRTLAVFPLGPGPMPTYAEVRHLEEAPGGALGILALLALLEGQPAEVATDLAKRSLATWSDRPDAHWPESACFTLAFTEEFDLVAEFLEGLMATGQRLGNPYLYATSAAWHGHLRYRVGRLADAEADCLAVRDIILHDGAVPFALTYPCTFLSEIMLERGDLAAAEGYLDEAVPGPWGHSAWFLDVRGRLRTAQGRIDEALEDFAIIAAFAERLRSPAYASWRSNLALALDQRGDRDEALRLAIEELELARAQGTPRAIGIALRTRGLIEGGAAGLASLQESVAVLDDSQAALERARSLCELGAALRRARQPKASREPLRRALDLAHRCGATALVDRAREELAAAGAKPRRLAVTGVDALTPSERRVAQLAAEGLSNREIAQSLFVSAWTVATHLTAAYQKLGITGRSQLAAVLPARPGPRDDLVSQFVEEGSD